MWVRIDDRLPRHPKILAAGALLGRDGTSRAIACFLTSLCYCAEHLTDGQVSPEALGTMRQQVWNPHKTAEALATVGLFERIETGYQIHDYHNYNPSAVAVKEKRARDSARKRGGILTESNAAPDGIRAESRADTRARDPVPSRPVPKQIIWFDKIYAVYPNKDRKEQANRAWCELGPSGELASTIYADVVRRTQAGWVKLERRFIPQLATFLRDRMWEDAATTEAYSDDNPDPEKVRHAWSCKVCGKVHEGTRAQRGQPLCVLDAIPK